jgi:hypothetical protein
VSERLLRLLHDAARGAPPPADGLVEVWPAPPGAVDAVLGFTAHYVVAAGVDPDLVAARLPDGDLSAPMGATFLGWLGERLGSTPGSLDVVLAADGLGGAPPLELAPAVDLDRHERVARALRYRDDLQVWTAREGPGCWCSGGGWPAAARWRSRSTRGGATAAWAARWSRPPGI